MTVKEARKSKDLSVYVVFLQIKIFNLFVYLPLKKSIPYVKIHVRCRL